MRVVWLRGRCWWVAGWAGSAGCPEPLSNGQDQMCGIEGRPPDQRVFGTPSGLNVPKRPSQTRVTPDPRPNAASDDRPGAAFGERHQPDLRVGPAQRRGSTSKPRWPSRLRAAQVPWARHGEGSGSGYRLGQRLVLTAPHVITSAMGPTGGQLLVRVPEWLPAEPIWDDEDADAALRADGESTGELERSFGVSRANRLPCTARLRSRRRQRRPRRRDAENPREGSGRWPRRVGEWLMPRAPRITSRQLLRVLRALDWTPVAQRGSHVHLTHPDRPGRVTVPVHAGETLKPTSPRHWLRSWTRRGSPWMTCARSYRRSDRHADLHCRARPRPGRGRLHGHGAGPARLRHPRRDRRAVPRPGRRSHRRPPGGT